MPVRGKPLYLLCVYLQKCRWGLGFSVLPLARVVCLGPELCGSHSLTTADCVTVLLTLHRQTSAPAFSSHKNHQHTKGMQRRALDRAIQGRGWWVNAPDSPPALEVLLQRGTMSTRLWSTMLIACDAQLAIPTLLLLAQPQDQCWQHWPHFQGISASLLCPDKEGLCLNQGINSGVKQEWAGQAHALPPNASSNSHFCLPNTADIC